MSDNNHRPLARHLSQRRGELELTQAQVAEKIGVSTEEYARWERGDVLIPRVPSRPKIASFLDMSYDELDDLLERLDAADLGDTEKRILSEVRRLLDQRGS